MKISCDPLTDSLYIHLSDRAAADTGMDEAAFPEHPPFSLEQVLSRDWA